MHALNRKIKIDVAVPLPRFLLPPTPEIPTLASGSQYHSNNMNTESRLRLA